MKKHLRNGLQIKSFYTYLQYFCWSFNKSQLNNENCWDIEKLNINCDGKEDTRISRWRYCCSKIPKPNISFSNLTFSI